MPRANAYGTKIDASDVLEFGCNVGGSTVVLGALAQGSAESTATWSAD